MLIAEDVGAVRRARRSKADIDDIRWGVVQVNLELLPIRELSPLLHRRIYRSHLGQERLLLASLRILLQ